MNGNEAELLISMIAAGIFIYLLTFESVKLPFYLKSESHPHPLVRLFGVLSTTIDYIEFVSSKQQKLQLRREPIFIHLISNAKILSESILDGATRQIVDSLFSENLQDATQYCKELQGLVDSDPGLAKNKRNFLARQKK